MTTAISNIRKDNAVAIAPRNDVDDVVDFPSLVAMGDQLVRTGFLPDHIRTGVQFAAIVMAGKELGMTTMRSCRSLFLVKGKVIEDAASQLARFKAAGGRSDFKVLDETKAVLWLQHPNGDEHTETWTVEDSKRAGLSGGNHDKFRKAMLRSRVITSGLKSVGWDGAVGAYDASELAEDLEPPAPKMKTVTATIADSASPMTKVAPDLGPVLDLAEAIVDADSAEALAWATQQIGGVTEEGSKLDFALSSLIGQRSCQLRDEEWATVDRAKKAVAWLRGLLDARTTASAEEFAARNDKPTTEAA